MVICWHCLETALEKPTSCVLVGDASCYKDCYAEMAEAVRAFVQAIRETLLPPFLEISHRLRELYIFLQREQLRRSLSRWLPDRLARRLSERWPERLLPRLKL